MKTPLCATLAWFFAVMVIGFSSQQADAKKVVGGVEANERIERLTSEIHWYDSLADAQAEARRTGKLIFWVHIRGQLAGAT